MSGCLCGSQYPLWSSVWNLFCVSAAYNVIRIFVMQTVFHKIHVNKIAGTICCYDRIIFHGSLSKWGFTHIMNSYLMTDKIIFKDDTLLLKNKTSQCVKPSKLLLFRTKYPSNIPEVLIALIKKNIFNNSFSIAVIMKESFASSPRWKYAIVTTQPLIESTIKRI